MSNFPNLSKQLIVKNSMAGSDAVYRDGELNVLNCVDAFPSVFTKSINNAPYWVKSLQEILQVRTYSFTAAANTIYSFVIEQVISKDNNKRPFTFSYDSTAGAVDTQIRDAFIAAINASSAELTASISASNVFTVTANTGYATFTARNLVDLTEANAQTTYSPNGTPANAFTNVIAPNGTPATAIGGTNTVTVTTLADHLLRPGDVIELASTTAFLMTYTNNVRLSNNSDFGKTFSGATGGLFRVGTVPTSTTFTLDGVTGNGVTNTGTITITTRSVAFIQTLASETIETGKSLNITGVATMTIAPITNDVVGTAGSEGIFRVGVGGTGTRFLLENVFTVGIGNNSGTITITEEAQDARYTGNALIRDVTNEGGVISTNNYSSINFNFGEPNGDLLGAQTNLGKNITLLANESDANSDLFFFNLYKALEEGYVR